MGNEDSEQTNEATETTETTETTDTSATTADETNSPAEGQPEGEATPDASEGAGDPAYEPFTLPEGWEITDEDNAAFSALATDMELSQENAQKLVDLFISTNDGRATAAESDAEPVDGPAEWQTALHADETLGGDNLDQTQANIDLATGLMDKDTLAYFKDSGRHFELPVARFLNKLGTMLQENPVDLGGGGSPGGDGKTAAQNMFAKSGHV